MAVVVVVHKHAVRRICKTTAIIMCRVLGDTKAEYFPSPALLAVIFRC
jgi:hypothetical protein